MIDVAAGRMPSRMPCALVPVWGPAYARRSDVAVRACLTSFRRGSARRPVRVVLHQHIQRHRVRPALLAVVGDVDRGGLDRAPPIVHELQRQLVARGEVALQLDLVERLAAGHRGRLDEQTEDRLYELVADTGME